MPDFQNDLIDPALGKAVDPGNWLGQTVSNALTTYGQGLLDFARIPGDIYAGKYSIDQISHLAPAYATQIALASAPIGGGWANYIKNNTGVEQTLAKIVLNPVDHDPFDGGYLSENAKQVYGFSIEKQPSDPIFQQAGSIYDIKNKDGIPIGGAYVTFENDGKTANINNIWSAGEGDAGTIWGPANTREIAREFLRVHPDVENIGGERVTGARSNNPLMGQILKLNRNQLLGGQ